MLPAQKFSSVAAIEAPLNESKPLAVSLDAPLYRGFVVLIGYINLYRCYFLAKCLRLETEARQILARSSFKLKVRVLDIAVVQIL